jgi:hypothetical protein
MCVLCFGKECAMGKGEIDSFWPSIENPERAVTVMHYGAGFAAFSALVTAGISIAAIYLDHPIVGIDGWALVDAGLYSIIAWRVYRLSLPWSIAGLIMFTFERLFGLMQHLNLGAIIFTIFFFPYYLNAVRGALYLRSARIPALAPVPIAEATMDDHEAFREHMMQSHRPFRKPGISMNEEFNLWLADRQEKRASAAAMAATQAANRGSVSLE